MISKKIFPLFFLPVFFQGCASRPDKDREYRVEQKSLSVDSSFLSPATVEHICPCNTTLTDLQKTGTLQPAGLENMELGKNCISKDARFEEAKGFLVPGIKGMIVQKDESTDYVAKIHLTREFEGRLPNGRFVSVKNLTLKAARTIYPGLDYSTRDCSDYWSYQNDTIHFYFKVDPSIKRYPLDEAFYADKPIEGIDIVLWCYGLFKKEYAGDLVYERPLYAPLSVTHINVYAWKKRNDLGTKLKELTSTGKKTNYDMIKLGKWLLYSPDHQLVSEEYYDNKGNLLKKVK